MFNLAFWPLNNATKQPEKNINIYVKAKFHYNRFINGDS